jgi:hypothetical protein
MGRPQAALQTALYLAHHYDQKTQVEAAFAKTFAHGTHSLNPRIEILIEPTKANPPEEPLVVKLTETLVDMPDPVAASSVSDMIVIFYGCGGTVLGSIAASFLYLSYAPIPGGNRALWIGYLLACVLLGGAIG